MRDDGGGYLRQLVQASRTGPEFRQQGGGVRWEFPKGRRLSDSEPDLDCAIREFEEEAGVAKQAYQILPGFKRRVAYVHMGVRYVNVYYVAIARRPLSLSIDFRVLDQVAEVSEVRWMSIEQIRLIDTPARRLEATVAPVFRYVKRYVRGLLPARAFSLWMAPGGAGAETHSRQVCRRRRRQSAADTGPRPLVTHRKRDLERKDSLLVGLFPAAPACGKMAAGRRAFSGARPDQQPHPGNKALRQQELDGAETLLQR